jgi:hypothetical protein
MDYGIYITSGLFIISEILPFIPVSGNGFFHTFIEILKGVLSIIKNKQKEINDINTEKDSKIILNKTADDLKKRLDEVNKQIENLKYLEKQKSEKNICII